MPDPVADYLRTLNTSDRARAAAWDAAYATDDADAQERLKALPFSNEVRAALWDLRQGGTLEGTPTDPVQPINDQFTEAPAQPEGSATWRVLSNAGPMLNPITAAQGLAQAVAHPVQTYHSMVDASADQFGKAGEAFKSGRLSTGIGHGLAGVLPAAGPAVANATEGAIEQFAAGDWAGAAGTALGLGLGTVLGGPITRGVGRVIQRPAQAVARQLYQSALKPTKAVLKDVRTPGGGPDAARRTLVDTGLREGVPVSSRGARKVETLVESLNGEVEARLAKAEAQGLTVDPAFVDDQIRAVAADFTDQINAQPDLAAIQTVRENFATNPKVAQPQLPARPGEAPVVAPGPLPIQTAQTMKRNTYKGLRGKYGVERGATIEAEKAGARGLREQIEAQAGDEVGALNAREGSLIPLEEAIADAMRRRGNYSLFGLTPAVAAIPAVAHGNIWPLLATVVDRAPGVISRTGVWVNRTGTRSGRRTQSAARATVTANQQGALVPVMAEERQEGQGPARSQR